MLKYMIIYDSDKVVTGVRSYIILKLNRKIVYRRVMHQVYILIINNI